MFRIIYTTVDAQYGDVDMNLLSQRFEARDEADKFIRETLILDYEADHNERYEDDPEANPNIGWYEGNDCDFILEGFAFSELVETTYIQIVVE